MTKTYKKIYGNQDTEEVVHYGSIVYNVDLHPKQIQPEHIVITSPYFRTDEHTFNSINGVKKKATQEQKDRAAQMHKEGLTYRTIAAALGYHWHTIARFCKENA